MDACLSARVSPLPECMLRTFTISRCLCPHARQAVSAPSGSSSTKGSAQASGGGMAASSAQASTPTTSASIGVAVSSDRKGRLHCCKRSGRAVSACPLR